jgi:hypothetical protein
LEGKNPQGDPGFSLSSIVRKAWIMQGLLPSQIAQQHLLYIKPATDTNLGIPAWYQGAPARSSHPGFKRRGAGLGEPLPLDTPLLSVPSSLYTSCVLGAAATLLHSSCVMGPLMYSSGVEGTTRLYSPDVVEGATSLYSSDRTGSSLPGRTGHSS